MYLQFARDVAPVGDDGDGGIGADNAGAGSTGAGRIRITQMGCPMNLSKCPPRYDHAGYPEGYHTEEILASLGYSEEEIREMT